MTPTPWNINTLGLLTLTPSLEVMTRAAIQPSQGHCQPSPSQGVCSHRQRNQGGSKHQKTILEGYARGSLEMQAGHPRNRGCRFLFNNNNSCVRGVCHATAFVRRSKDNPQDSVLIFYGAGSGNRTRAWRQAPFPDEPPPGLERTDLTTVQEWCRLSKPGKAARGRGWGLEGRGHARGRAGPGRGDAALRGLLTV